MQRLANKIYREFSPLGKYIEIHVLDGNGDPFQVFQGYVQDISGHNFVNVLRDAGCFYFFQVAAVPDDLSEGFEQPIIRRDLCWLTDPSAPRLIDAQPFSVSIEWDPVRFCGIDPPSVLDSVTYSIEIAEGVEWKDGKLSQYMNDIMIPTSSYKSIFKGKSLNQLVIKELKSATWYHIRLIVDYLGLRVISEAANVHTVRSPPSAPSIPRLSVFPVRNSFDLQTDIPARLESLITWNQPFSNGTPVISYQVHLRRLDEKGATVNDDPPLLHRITAEPPSTQKAIAVLLNSHITNNQWIQSPSKSEQQIRNSIKSRSGLKSSGRASSPQRPGTQSSAFSPIVSSQQPRHQSPSSGHSWRIIYDNLHRSLRLGAPRATDAMWQVRVRARNSEGWSAFSPILEVSHRTHPTLFSNQAVVASKSGQGSPEPDLELSGTTSMKGSFVLNSPLMQSFSGQQQLLQLQQQSQQQQQQQQQQPDIILPPAVEIERPISRMPNQFGDLDAAANGINNGLRPLPELGSSQPRNNQQLGSRGGYR